MTLLELSPADRHRAVAGDFATVVGQVSDWGAATPVREWVARDVVEHLTTWFPGFLAAGGVTLPAGPDAAVDPAAAWHHHTDAVQALLDDPATAEQHFRHPYGMEGPLADIVTSFYTADVFMHTWDIARAAGVEVDLDPDWCAELVGGMSQMDEVLRSSGQYGPAVPVPDDADPQTRLVGFIGRDPHWQPASA